VGAIVNFFGLIIGPPEFGKTSLAVEIVETFLAQDVNVFAHDPNRQFRGRCAEYADAAAWRSAAEAAAKTSSPMPRGSLFGCKAKEVRDLMVDLGQKWNDVDRVRVPMLGVFDEGSMLGTSGPTWISEEDQMVISNRRHLGMGLLINLQRPTMLTSAFSEIATDVYLLQQNGKRVDALEETLNLRPGALARVVELPPHRYVHWTRKGGLTEARV
jgi:hypothetical protein